MTRQDWERIKAEGYQARTLGKRRDQCPYRKPLEEDAWESGWMDADEERKRCKT